MTGGAILAGGPWSLADFMAQLNQAWAVVIVGLATAGGSLAVFWRNSVANRRSAERLLFSDALADVIAWKELPYRIARRFDDSADSKRQIVSEFHALQQALENHMAWIRITDEDVFQAYDALVRGVRQGCEAHIKDAWTNGPQDVSFLGPKYATDTAKLEQEFVEAVRRRLR